MEELDKNDHKWKEVQKRREVHFWRRHWVQPVIIRPGSPMATGPMIGESICNMTPVLHGERWSAQMRMRLKVYERPEFIPNYVINAYFMCWIYIGEIKFRDITEILPICQINNFAKISIYTIVQSLFACLFPFMLTVISLILQPSYKGLDLIYSIF